MVRLVSAAEKGLMLFNSYPFIFLFLPAVLLGYFALGRRGGLAPVVWLALASLTFYAFSGWPFVPLLAGSIAFNFAVGYLLIEKKMRPALRFTALTIGVGGDLLLLGIFKYAGFFAANLNALFSTGIAVNIGLPVGISFYTFTQIAFLVDAYRGHVARYALPHYALFVTYFPHLIAGPILHHRDMIPQFERAESKIADPHLILCGLIIFGIGLFKKTGLADGIQPLVSLAFGQAAPSFDQTWIGAQADTFQLYFDFSGYSDMAIGISLMFGIFLPLNFNSPYKAASIIDFWRRWHMTLSAFLRDYLYIPLGGNRHGRMLRYLNLMITMLLGGLWHGAAWTFVVWGALHGAYLCINHAWSHFVPKPGPRLEAPARLAGLVLTFAAVVVAWVLFRADSVASALSILAAMADPGHIVLGRAEAATVVLVAIYAGGGLVSSQHATVHGL
jgi:D-alanyl-lipoteichoic acid acyltransferase DltB (MBOAT superfamily)